MRSNKRKIFRQGRPRFRCLMDLFYQDERPQYGSADFLRKLWLAQKGPWSAPMSSEEATAYLRTL